MDDVDKFIKAYSNADSTRIVFAWNGKHAENCVDANYEFRKQVLARTCRSLNDAPITLIRDLFRAETEMSRESWCVDNRVADLATTLLTRGGDDFVMDFLHGKSQSFDASMACGGIDITSQRSRQLLAEVERRLANEPSENDRELLELGKTIFSERANSD